MKVIIIAAIARNGVIGRTSKACPVCVDGNARMGRGCARCDGTGLTSANDIPWSYPEDARHFRDVTMGHAVIMGRRTWESLPAQHRPLKGRTNYVVSQSMYEHALRASVAKRDDWRSGALPHLDEPKYILRPTLEQAIERASGHGTNNTDRAYIIGGAKLYAAALPLADELDLTLIDRDYEGDVKFPDDWLPRPELGAGAVVAEDGTRFECVERRKGDHSDLTFTRWVRR